MPGEALHPPHLPHPIAASGVGGGDEDPRPTLGNPGKGGVLLWANQPRVREVLAPDDANSPYTPPEHLRELLRVFFFCMPNAKQYSIPTGGPNSWGTGWEGGSESSLEYYYD